MSQLDQIIPPEIFHDELYRAILKLAAEAPLQHILEIGSSSGGGSSEAFAVGIARNPTRPMLHCMEISAPRFQALQERYRDNPQVHCLRASSVGLEQFPQEKEVSLFYRFIPTALNRYPLEMVLGWLRQDIAYLRESGAPQHGIRLIKERFGIKTFDMVLIDGSEFLGRAELDEVYGAGIIVLDDVNGFKNYHNYHRLAADGEYFIALENLAVRNGFAIFIRR